MNIVLIGFRCAGKSTVGKALGERVRREFIDSDAYIERRTGMTVRQLFESRGESSFRQHEAEVLTELCKLDGKVIAAGGGAVLWYKNIRNLKRNGLVVLLECDPDTLWKRFESDSRTPSLRPPLTNLGDARREILDQLERRAPYYRKAADFTIDTSAKDVNGVVQEILRHLEGRELLGQFV